MYTFIPVLILTLLVLLSAAVLTDDEGTGEPDLRKKDTDSLSLSFRFGSGASGSQTPTLLEAEPRALAGGPMVEAKVLAASRQNK